MPSLPTFDEYVASLGHLADLRRIYQLWQTQQIDGMYTLGTLDSFRADLAVAARRAGLIT